MENTKLEYFNEEGQYQEFNKTTVPKITTTESVLLGLVVQVNAYMVFDFPLEEIDID